MSAPTRSGNIWWSVFRALAAGSVLLLVFREYWYKNLVTFNGNNLSLSIEVHEKLLSQEYGGWRLAVPISAGIVAVFSLLAAFGWGSERYPSVFAWFVRLVAFSAVVAAAAALILRQPLNEHPPPAWGAGVRMNAIVFSNHLNWASWVTLLAAIATLLLSIPIAVRIR